MRQRPFAFLRFGNRWINMSQVTDVEDRGDTMALFLATDMARLAGSGDQAVPLDVSRRVVLTDPEECEKLRRWLKLNDED